MRWKGVGKDTISKHLLDRSKKNHESAMLPQYSDLQQYARPPKHLHEVPRCTKLDRFACAVWELNPVAPITKVGG